MYFFIMDIENKITEKNSIYARMQVHRNIAESLKSHAESLFLHEILPNNFHYIAIPLKNTYA